MTKAKTFTITFTKQDFLNAIGILGFEHLNAIDQITKDDHSTYVNEIKHIGILIRIKPFRISITAKNQSFTETSYRRAYDIIHRIMT